MYPIPEEAVSRSGHGLVLCCARPFLPGAARGGLELRSALAWFVFALRAGCRWGLPGPRPRAYSFQPHASGAHARRAGEGPTAALKKPLEGGAPPSPPMETLRPFPLRFRQAYESLLSYRRRVHTDIPGFVRYAAKGPPRPDRLPSPATAQLRGIILLRDPAIPGLIGACPELDLGIPSRLSAVPQTIACKCNDRLPVAAFSRALHGAPCWRACTPWGKVTGIVH